MVVFKILLTFKDLLFLEMFSMVSVIADRGKRKMYIKKGMSAQGRRASTK